MARQLLLKSLVNIFGDFVDGLTEENLKVGVRLLAFMCVCVRGMDACLFGRSVDRAIGRSGELVRTCFDQTILTRQPHARRSGAARSCWRTCG